MNDVQAAGGLVVDEQHRVLVVHRPRRNDWSFPKGHLESTDASLLACALREVEEETGLRCQASTRTTMVHYLDHRQRSKQVTYWVMSVESGDFAPNDEVDEIRWLTLTEACETLSYASDRDVLDQLLR